MADRVIVLFGALVVAVLIYVAYRILRVRSGSAVERLDMKSFGLDEMDTACAFVMFTTAACRPCKAALRVVESASEKRHGLSIVSTVDAIERSDLAVEYGVRTIPTTFLITASGHVVRRWLDVPDPADVASALAEVEAA